MGTLIPIIRKAERQIPNFDSWQTPLPKPFLDELFGRPMTAWSRTPAVISPDHIAMKDTSADQFFKLKKDKLRPHLPTQKSFVNTLLNLSPEDKGKITDDRLLEGMAMANRLAGVGFDPAVMPLPRQILEELLERVMAESELQALASQPIKKDTAPESKSSDLERKRQVAVQRAHLQLHPQLSPDQRAILSENVENMIDSWKESDPTSAFDPTMECMPVAFWEDIVGSDAKLQESTLKLNWKDLGDHHLNGSSESKANSAGRNAPAPTQTTMSDVDDLRLPGSKNGKDLPPMLPPIEISLVPPRKKGGEYLSRYRMR
ncbi:hypothetical protein BDV95DRAFT_574801 [Massariosphaeria phaeospora]|uniref:Uncharacterized protein n=1 Tax=Massariosphaeria phaeospora TaxID=100035 RepID=A0A7C8I8L0_9PLEO|nr:hypothetical protein BDV95DRAFT_574801 [Massariosphaeria phaeospora]